MTPSDPRADDDSPPPRRYAVAIVGAGFGGLGLAMKLKAAGLDDFVVIDKNPEVGGTWYENRYPGAACDVESHLYCYSFLPQPAWSRRFAPQAEILTYLKDCAREKGIVPHLRLSTEVVGAVFDEAAAVWRLRTADGGMLEARVLVAACGQLNRPAIPALPGLDRFDGPCLHSARWDSGFDPAGKTVAVVGTGASAVQIVPELARKAARIVLFQRSGAWVLPKGDRAYRSGPHRAALNRAWLSLRNEARGIAFVRHPRLFAPAAWRARRAMAAAIGSADKRALLHPRHRIGCKRILLSDDWFATLGRDDVEVVAGAVERVEERAVVAVDGRRFPVDALVLATGFETGNPLRGLDLVGRAGRRLNDVWAKGVSAYKGLSVPGFPNLFLLYGPHTNLGHDSIVGMLEAQADYVMRALRALARPGVRALDVTPRAAAAFEATMARRLARTVWSTGCRSWYEGPDGRVTANWPGLVSAYRRLTRRFELGDHEILGPARSAAGRLPAVSGEMAEMAGT